MSFEDFAVVGVVVAIVAVPMVAFGRALRWVRRHQANEVANAAERGLVATAELRLLLGLIIGWAGFMFVGLSLLPLLVWIGDADTEARRVFLTLVGIGVAVTAAAVVLGRPGLRMWILEPDRITLRYRGREKAIAFDAITGFRDRRTLTGALDIEGTDASGATTTIRVPTQLSGFDEFLARLRREAPNATYSGSTGAASTNVAAGTNPSTSAVDAAASDVATGQVRRFAIPKRRTWATLGFLGVLLLTFTVGPWLLVEGDHPVRDGFIFMGIGFGLWAIIALLVGQESFQRGQPTVLELRPHDIAWRTWRGGETVRRDLDLVAATIETNIIYVRGIAGYRHPLFLRFTDGTTIEIDHFRARHLGATTHLIAAEIERRYLTTDHRPPTYRAAAEQWRARADRLAETGDTNGAIDAYSHAVATWPDATNLALYAEIAALHRDNGDHDLAVAFLRAHLAVSPTDEIAWQHLAASLRANGRDDLAADAIATAEQLLMR